MQKVAVKGHLVQKLRVEKDGRTEALAMPPVLTGSVINKSTKQCILINNPNIFDKSQPTKS